MNDTGGCAVEMVIDLVRSVGSANVCFRIGGRTCVADLDIDRQIDLDTCQKFTSF